MSSLMLPLRGCTWSTTSLWYPQRCVLFEVLPMYGILFVSLLTDGFLPTQVLAFEVLSMTNAFVYIIQTVPCPGRNIAMSSLYFTSLSGALHGLEPGGVSIDLLDTILAAAHYLPSMVLMHIVSSFANSLVFLCNTMLKRMEHINLIQVMRIK